MAARRRLLRWGSWFALVNAGVLALVGLRYLWYYAAVGPSVAWVYALGAFVGQMAIFAFIPLLAFAWWREASLVGSRLRRPGVAVIACS